MSEDEDCEVLKERVDEEHYRFRTNLIEDKYLDVIYTRDGIASIKFGSDGEEIEDLSILQTGCLIHTRGYSGKGKRIRRDMPYCGIN
jgi:hypothetical protein